MEQLCDKKVGDDVIILMLTPYQPIGGILIKKELNEEEIETLSKINNTFYRARNKVLVFSDFHGIFEAMKDEINITLNEIKCLLHFCYTKEITRHMSSQLTLIG